MNIDYLYSIIHLYLTNEKEHRKTILNITKSNDLVEFAFTMNKTDEDKTTFVIPYDVYSSRIYDLLNIYKEGLLVIDEKYNYVKSNSTCNYSVLFNSGRSISFKGFSVLDMNNVRNSLYGIEIAKDEIRVEKEEEKQMAYKPRLRLQQAGFSSYATLFFVAIVFLVVLVISLFIFKSFIK